MRVHAFVVVLPGQAFEQRAKSLAFAMPFAQRASPQKPTATSEALLKRILESEGVQNSHNLKK